MRDLKQEEAFKKMQRSTGKPPFIWNQDWLNFNSLAIVFCRLLLNPVEMVGDDGF